MSIIFSCQAILCTAIIFAMIEVQWIIEFCTHCAQNL